MLCLLQAKLQRQQDHFITLLLDKYDYFWHLSLKEVHDTPESRVSRLVIM